MNTGMLENPITQDNIATLRALRLSPSSRPRAVVLACKDVGSGRLPKEDVLIEYILHAIARPKDLAGLRIAVTAGPTQEPLDPVRYLTNHSTGKMGYAVARAGRAAGRGRHPHPRPHRPCRRSGSPRTCPSLPHRTCTRP